MKGKWLIVIGTIVMQGYSAKAQYVPNSSQAYQFASVYNPAFTGTEVYGDLKLGYRYQWTGFGADAPKFINITYNFRLNQSLDLKRNALRTSAPEAMTRIPKSKGIFHALGSNVFHEKVGIIDRLGGGLNYSFHAPLSQRKDVKLATGLSVMLENTRVNINEVYLGNNPDPDPFYDKLLSSGANRTDLHVRAGVLLYAPTYYVGFCYLPVWHAAVQTSEGNFADLFYKATAQAGVTFPIGSTIDLKPSIQALLQTNNELLCDYSLKVYFLQKVWLGATYRDTKSGVGLIGFTIAERLIATYSYEVPTRALRQFSDGSHELVLSIRLNNGRGTNQYIW